jgi:hypothetical protein
LAGDIGEIVKGMEPAPKVTKKTTPPAPRKK